MVPLPSSSSPAAVSTLGRQRGARPCLGVSIIPAGSTILQTFLPPASRCFPPPRHRPIGTFCPFPSPGVASSFPGRPGGPNDSPTTSWLSFPVLLHRHGALTNQPRRNRVCLTHQCYLLAVHCCELHAQEAPVALGTGRLLQPGTTKNDGKLSSSSFRLQSGGKINVPGGPGGSMAM
jgi:hypothetical protein